MKYGIVVYVVLEGSEFTVHLAPNSTPLPPNAMVVYAQDNTGTSVDLNNFPEDSPTDQLIKAKIHDATMAMFLTRASGFPNQR